MIMLDLAWSSCFSFLSLFIIIMNFFNLDMSFNKPFGVISIFGLVILWSLRLSYFLFIKVRNKIEDGRYAILRDRNPQGWSKLQFFLFPFEAVLVFILYLPFMFIYFKTTNSLREVNSFFYLGLVLFAISFVGEVWADYQLKKFKAIRKNPLEICQIGLWNYSRHPNYFFECLIWVSFFFIALGLIKQISIIDIGWLALSPLLMVYLILFVTGIPLSEELAVRKKGEKYKIYQNTTSKLVPWFKKK